MTQANRRAFTSIRARLFIQNRMIGWVNDFSLNEAFTNIGVREIGDARVQIHETVAYDVTGSFGYMHILEESFASRNNDSPSTDPWLAPDWTSDPVTANTPVVLFEPKEITLKDWVTNTNILTVYGMKPEGRGWRLSEGGLMMVQCSFVATAAVEHKEVVITA